MARPLSRLEEKKGFTDVSSQPNLTQPNLTKTPRLHYLPGFTVGSQKAMTKPHPIPRERPRVGAAFRWRWWGEGGVRRNLRGRIMLDHCVLPSEPLVYLMFV